MGNRMWSVMQSLDTRSEMFSLGKAAGLYPFFNPQKFLLESFYGTVMEFGFKPFLYSTPCFEVKASSLKRCDVVC